MKIEFEISEAQEKALTEIQAELKAKKQNLEPSDLVKKVFVQFLIQAKQRMVAKELQ